MVKYLLIISGIVFPSYIYSQQNVTNTPHIVTYDLNVKDTFVNYTGRSRHAIAINGQIPGPTIELTEGDTAIIRVHNLMHVTTSIHWHGILIPNQFDGVPGLTTFPIKSDSTLTVVFPVRQNGTYWYHSHTMTQEQIGLTGSIVIHKRNAPRMKEEVIVLNDWTDTKPSEVWRLLKRRSDWYSIKKNSVQSYGEAIAAGSFGDKLKQEWMRMPAMDISDVKYNYFFINGRLKYDFTKYKPGDEIRLRIVNASSSSYFWMQFAGGKMKVVAADGQNVEPVDVDKFLIATAETYDVIIKIPSSGKYELRATAQDISAHASAFFGEGNKVMAPDIPKVDYFKIMHHMNTMMSSMNMTMGISKMPMKNIELNNGMNGMKMDGMDMHDMKMDNEKDTSSMKMDRMDMNGMKIDNKKDTSSMKMDGMNMQDMKMDNQKNTSSMKMDGMNMNGMKMDNKKDTVPMKGMDMNGMDMKGMSMKVMSMGGMNMPMYGFSYPPGNGNDKVLSYAMLHATNDDPVIPRPSGKPDRLIELTATGNMFRYVWSFNNVNLTDADKILIKKGEHVRVIFHNNTMMEHPLHLHGHFFRLLNGSTLNDAPLKHTFNLLPMATDTIDFAADEEKDWFFHCHTLYHMLSGMARVFHYDNTLPEVQRDSPKDYKMFLKEHGQHTFLWGSASLQSQGAFVNATLAGTKWELNEEANYDWKKRYESETMLRKFLDKRQFLTVFIGADNRRERTSEIKDGKHVLEYKNLATAGLTYFLPMFITAEGRIDHEGNFRFQLSRHDLELTKRARFDFSWNTDKEYMLGLKYVVGRNFGISGSYDSDYGWGAGISLIY